MITSLTLVKDFFGIPSEDNSLNNRITFFIPIIEADYLRIRNSPFDKNGENIKYPAGSDIVSAQMVMFKINQTGKVSVNNGKVESESDISSETMGSYSVYYKASNALSQSGEFKYGYPIEIVSQIKRFIGFDGVRI